MKDRLSSWLSQVAQIYTRHEFWFWFVVVAAATVAVLLVWRSRPEIFPDTIATAGWTLSAIIILWTIVGARRAKKALENTERMLGVTLERYPDFAAHVHQMCGHLGRAAVACPVEVTLVLSSLAYGIRARCEHGERKGAPDPAQDAFGALLTSWLGAWECQAGSDHPGTFVLRVCVWPPEKHREQFGFGTGGSHNTGYDKMLEQYIDKTLRPFLEGVNRLERANKLSVVFSTTLCDEVRIALVKGPHRDGGNGYEYRTTFLAITLLRVGIINNDAAVASDVKYLGFTSKDEGTFGQVKTFADECFHSRPLDAGFLHHDVDKFLASYFGDRPKLS